MPINFEHLPQGLKDAARTGTLVPFIGAGISRLAKTPKPSAIPTWSEFLAELVDVAEEVGDVSSEETQEIRQLIFRGKSLMAAEAIKSAVPSDLFETYIRRRFAPLDAEPSEIHRSIFRLQPSLILTTNYDHLLEDSYASVFGRTCEVVSYEDAHRVQRLLVSERSDRRRERGDRPIVFKLRGTASFPSRVIFGESDYRKLVYQQPGFRAILAAIFVTRVVLMLGWSVSDPELSTLVETLRENFRHRTVPDYSARHYIVLQKGLMGSVERKRFRSDFGLELIEYEQTSELLDLVNYLASLIEENAHPVTSS